MKEEFPKAQNPLVLRYHRMLEAFSKSDDERSFYFDRVEGFLLYIDLDKNDEELAEVEQEIKNFPDRYCLIPRFTFYETKKFMEGFIHEKVYDIDTKEKLVDIISTKEAKENFLEFIYDHLIELDKWQQYYHERSRIRIIEWLKKWNIRFVFEEDLELTKRAVEELKENTFEVKVTKDIAQARDALEKKANVYYSNEALNPRPKRGRPPKQQVKTGIEPVFGDDFYTKVPIVARPFLFAPKYASNAISFSSKFENEEQILASLKGSAKIKVDSNLEKLSQRLESLRHISQKVQKIQVEETEYDKKLKTAISAEVEKMETEKKTPRISKIVQKVLPKESSKKRGIKELIKEKKDKGTKKVTQIKYKSNKKK